MTCLPLVSIVLPTHNGSKYIRRSIDSCLDQTHRNIELIIVDDASTDATPRIISGYSDDRIVYIRNKNNLRLPGSLNAGFALARGEYLTWTSDDNFYAPAAVEKMTGFLLRGGQDFVYCDYYTFKEGAEDRLRHVQVPDTATFRQVNFVRACFLYSRRVMEVTGDYDPQTELSEDYDYWIRVSKKFPLSHLKEPLYYYRLHAQALYSRRFWEQELTKCLVRFKHGIFSKEETKRFLSRLWIRKRNLPLENIIYPLIHFVFGRDLDRQLSAFGRQTSCFSECKAAVARKVF